MTLPISRRRFVRTLAVALLMLALSANALLAAVTDLHESQHVLQADDPHGDHKDTEAPADTVDESVFLHALMHSGHCCSHSAALFPAVQAIAPMLAMSPPPDLRSALRPDAGRPRLLRPPIHG